MKIRLSLSVPSVLTYRPTSVAAEWDTLACTLRGARLLDVVFLALYCVVYNRQRTIFFAGVYTVCVAFAANTNKL